MKRERPDTVTFSIGRRRLRLLLIGAAIAALAFPAGVVYANHAFEDVQTASTHHDAITAIRDAGVTLGCNDAGTEYCPDDEVTRDQMASFLDRLGALSGQTPTVNAATAEQADHATTADDADRLQGRTGDEFVGATEPVTVVAAGRIDATGAIEDATPNVSNASRDGTGTYTVEFADDPVDLRTAVVSVTATTSPRMIETGSVNGGEDLRVFLEDESGSPAGGGFTFVIHDPTP